jgi:hypothetical protein
MSMTRLEAIDHLRGLSGRVASQFCVTPEDYEAMDQETDDALTALGATPAELGAGDGEGSALKNKEN